jgi:hypothetical protein
MDRIKLRKGTEYYKGRVKRVWSMGLLRREFGRLCGEAGFVGDDGCATGGTGLDDVVVEEETVLEGGKDVRLAVVEEGREDASAGIFGRDWFAQKMKPSVKRSEKEHIEKMDVAINIEQE